MSNHNIRFYGEIRKIINYHQISTISVLLEMVPVFACRHLPSVSSYVVHCVFHKYCSF